MDNSYFVSPSPARYQDLRHIPMEEKKEAGAGRVVMHFTLLFTKSVQFSLEIVKLLLPCFSISLQFFSLFYHLNKLEGVWIFFSSQVKHSCKNNRKTSAFQTQNTARYSQNVIEYFNTINKPLPLYLKVTVLCGHASTQFVGNVFFFWAVYSSKLLCCSTSQGP